MHRLISMCVRRAMHAAALLLGANLLTFVLFFSVATPDDMARVAIGGKHVTPMQIEDWTHARGYDRPLYWNPRADSWRHVTHTVFWDRSVSLFALDFGRPDGENAGNIGHDIAERAGVSLQLALPLLVLQTAAGVGLAMLLVLQRGTLFDWLGGVACVLALSVSVLFYMIVGQALWSRVLHLAPASGDVPGAEAARFLALPVALALLARLGSDARLYRAVLLEEVGRDPVRAARAQGASEWRLLWRHVLPNAGVPILTLVGGDVPYVVLGSVVFERYFGIPGLGAYLVDAIGAQDYAIVRAMVFVGAVVHVVAFFLIDLGQALLDPRLRDQQAVQGPGW